LAEGKGWVFCFIQSFNDTGEWRLCHVASKVLLGAGLQLAEEEKRK
jgi:hypothetical protein